jgi:phosphohistidine phosphatase
VNVYIVRHGEAEPVGGEIRDDHLRTLTHQGRADAEVMANAMVNIDLNIAAILTSPLVRAVETAEIFGRALKRDPVVSRRLEPGFEPQALLEEIRAVSNDASVIAIGHQPDMGLFVSYLISPAHMATVAMETCAVACVHLPGNGPAQLRWLLTPSIVRHLTLSF